MTLKDESPRLEGLQYAAGKEWRTTTNSSRKNELVPERISAFGKAKAEMTLSCWHA